MIHTYRYIEVDTFKHTMRNYQPSMHIFAGMKVKRHHMN